MTWTQAQKTKRYYELVQSYHTYLGGMCVECGSTERLEIDHIDPATKMYNLVTRKASVENSKDELDKCQLLCHDCHTKKTNSMKPTPKTLRPELITSESKHGVGTYRFGCRCDVCRGAHNAYMRAYKKRARNK